MRSLNRETVKDRQHVLYWMQASQRSEYNHGLQYSILKANALNRPIVVFFGIAERFSEANLRHYYFMLQGLREVRASLEEIGVKLVVRRTSPEDGVVELSKNASLIVVDRGYLRIQRDWRRYVADRVDCPLIQVESDVIVPVQEASPKEEYSAATFRPKIRKKLEHYLVPLEDHRPERDSLEVDLDSLQVEDVEELVSHLDIDRSAERVHEFKGGTSEAKKRLEDFLKNKLDDYAEMRNDPASDFCSNMSPYLHFGQISPLYIALRVLDTDSLSREAYLEQLIVRRELSMNFVFYNQEYDCFTGLPNWAKKTLSDHRTDPREQIYTVEELENAETHDPYWNAAQKEMIVRGKMHGYMRMYWGKKILEWMGDPCKAFMTALCLNNKYELDGRDPNGFAGVAWCFGKHDRPWKERDIFGKTRYMNAKGLERKFDIESYVERIEPLV